MSLQRAELSRPQVDPARPVGPQVLSILRHRIITSELPPGTRISEAEVAALYGVSRQPVREAFIKLADEDLVEVRPQRGTFVRKIVVAAVQDARFVREAIEADIVTLIAATPDRALVDDLRRQIVAQRQVIGGDPSDFIPLDDRFHRTLAEAAGRPFGWTVIEGMKSQMDRVRRYCNLMSGNLSEVCALRRSAGGHAPQQIAAPSCYPMELETIHGGSQWTYDTLRRLRLFWNI